MITEISSPANPLFKTWKTLDSAKGIRKAGQFFLMGEKLVREFLDHRGNFKIRGEVYCEDLNPLLKPSERIPLFKLSKSLFKEIDFVGTHFNLLLLELPDIPSVDLSTAPRGLELICPLGDPGNLGAVLRSAAAFGASRVILTEEAAFPFSPKAVKASAGCVLQMPLVRAGELQELPLHGTYALDMEGSDLANFPWPRDLRLLIGEEGPGLGHLKGLMKLKIDTGPVESLNATVAASIALYSYRQALKPSVDL